MVRLRDQRSAVVIERPHEFGSVPVTMRVLAVRETDLRGWWLSCSQMDADESADCDGSKQVRPPSVSNTPGQDPPGRCDLKDGSNRSSTGELVPGSMKRKAMSWDG